MGLQKIIALRQRLEQIDQFMRNVALPTSIRELAPVIEDLVIAQLEKGMDGDGNFLPDYSPVSVHRYGKKPGPMTLHDKGGFYRGIIVREENEGIEMDSTDPKTPGLEALYGRNILKLSVNSLIILKHDYLIIELGKKVKDFLKFGHA